MLTLVEDGSTTIIRRQGLFSKGRYYHYRLYPPRLYNRRGNSVAATNIVRRISCIPSLELLRCDVGEAMLMCHLHPPPPQNRYIANCSSNGWTDGDCKPTCTAAALFPLPYYFDGPQMPMTVTAPPQIRDEGRLLNFI